VGERDGLESRGGQEEAQREGGAKRAQADGTGWWAWTELLPCACGLSFPLQGGRERLGGEQ
jgi:hypothetical protein